MSLDFVAVAQAEQRKPILLNGSRSPDHQKNMVIVDANAPDFDSGGAMGTVKIREIKTGKILGAFDWAGFGVHPDADTFGTILWRPDSKAFAVSSAITHGYIGCKAYILSGRHCREVRFPDYVSQVEKKCGVKFDEKGHEIPVKWLEDNRLIVEVGNRRCGKLFWVILKIIDTPRSPRPKAIVENIHLAP